MGFKQTEFKGYDTDSMNKFYQEQFNQAKNQLNYSDEQAHEHAKFMVEYYGHHFRKYA